MMIFRWLRDVHPQARMVEISIADLIVGMAPFLPQGPREQLSRDKVGPFIGIYVVG